MESNEFKKLNPKIRLFKYGITEMKTTNMYPLSLPDQKQAFEKILEEVLQVCGGDISKIDELGEIEFFLIIKDVVIDLFEDLVTKVFRESKDENIVSEIDNDQFVIFVQNVWEQNYENSLKNGKGLFLKIKDTFQKKRPSGSLSGITQATA